jgi:hypothetical protein
MKNGKKVSASSVSCHAGLDPASSFCQFVDPESSSGCQTAYFPDAFLRKKPFDSIMHNGLNNCNSPKAANPLLFRPARAVDDFFLSL